MWITHFLKKILKIGEFMHGYLTRTWKGILLWIFPSFDWRIQIGNETFGPTGVTSGNLLMWYDPI